MIVSLMKYIFASGILIFGPQPLSTSLNEELGFIYYLFSDCQSSFFDYWVDGHFCTIRNRYLLVFNNYSLRWR